MLAMLLGCGLRRSELTGLDGKGGHVRTVPIPQWVKHALDVWTVAAGVTEGRIFRAVSRAGKVWGEGISQNLVWYVVRSCCRRAGPDHIAPVSYTHLYVVVHASGPLKVIQDHEWLLKNVERLTNIHEAGAPVPWKVSDAPEDFIRSQLNGIVGLELAIQRLEGKWKMSQNRTERDRKGVIDGLAKLNTPESLAMKALVEEV